MYVVDRVSRIDKYLMEEMGISRSLVQKMIDSSYVLVNDYPVKCSYKLKINDVIRVLDGYQEDTRIEAEDIDLDIVYEDEYLLVVNKPSGMLTISTEKEKNRTLYHMVREYIHNKKKHEKIFIVHRLDRETSGLVLFCKNEELRDKIQENWENVAVKREYHAVVLGLMEKKKDRLVSYLKENKMNLVYVSKTNDGKEAITNYEVVRENKNSLLKIWIETGRKNQIRVQLANINHPILGDKKYGNLKGKRLLLCANRLDIRDPKSRKVLSFEINVPREYMRNL